MMTDSFWAIADVVALGCAVLAGVLWIVRCVEVYRSDRAGESSDSFGRPAPVAIAFLLAAMIALVLGILRMFAAELR